MITGINHITLAVSDLDRSFGFYTEALGCRPVARWATGAYLSAGDLWIALLIDDKLSGQPRPDYSHIAFSCDKEDFAGLVASLNAAGCGAWSENRSEGESFYFLDPDGHKLEIHVGDLATRLAAMKAKPWAPTEFFEDDRREDEVKR